MTMKRCSSCALIALAVLLSTRCATKVQRIDETVASPLLEAPASVSARVEAPAARTNVVTPKDPSGDGAHASVRDVSALLRPIRAKHDMPGMVGAILAGDELVAIGVDGLRKRDTQSKMTIDDSMHLGSYTKSMTARRIKAAIVLARRVTKRQQP